MRILEFREREDWRDGEEDARAGNDDEGFIMINLFISYDVRARARIFSEWLRARPRLVIIAFIPEASTPSRWNDLMECRHKNFFFLRKTWFIRDFSASGNFRFFIFCSSHIHKFRIIPCSSSNERFFRMFSRNKENRNNQIKKFLQTEALILSKIFHLVNLFT